MRKRLKILFVAIIVLLVLTGGGYFTYYSFFDPKRDSVESFERTIALDTLLTKKQALEDMDYLMVHIRKIHPAFIDGSDDLVEAINDQYEIEKRKLKEEISVLELWRATSRIAAELKTGHCYVFHNTDERYIDDITYFQMYKVLKVNGMPVSDLFQTFLSQFSYENGMEKFAETQFTNGLGCETQLQFIGIDTTDGVDLTFDTKAGEVTMHYDIVSGDMVVGASAPEYFVSYDIEEDYDIGIFTLKSCNYNNEYLNELELFFSEIKEKHINNIIVDLRDNGGGISTVANAFLEYVDVDSYCMSGGRDMRFGPILKHGDEYIVANKKKVDAFQGDLYILTSSTTYSSAMGFAVAISDNKLGTIVGEIPGNMPNCYTDIKGRFQMKNSKLCFLVPWKKIYRPDSTKGNQPLIPDFQVEADEAMEKTYELIIK